ncbi:hypothetical protein PR003_g29392 [Phytophthora rubi]|uniref:C2H2-type domain-containing protein n=1 Tax=Phytophthora rubi TaxID=129364 RepID=A0A6A4BM86_9STRA|nr:hypothetical protein PR003_g29392 [Phytophthora rubi]
MIHPGWVPGIFSFLRSKPGGLEQESHQDYQEKDLARVRKVYPHCVPGSMIFALEPNTNLRVYTGCFEAKVDSKARIVDVPVGFCVLFREHGECEHCGVKMIKGSLFRLHCFYCDKNPKGPENRLKRKSENKTGEFECPVCKKVFERQGTLRVHKLRKHSAQT